MRCVLSKLQGVRKENLFDLESRNGRLEGAPIEKEMYPQPSPWPETTQYFSWSQERICYLLVTTSKENVWTKTRSLVCATDQNLNDASALSM